MSARATSWVSALVPGDGDPRHGLNGYCNLGCRCDICREANSAYHKAIRTTRKRRLEAGLIEREHGTLSTYLNYGCRCAECRRAVATRARERRAVR